MMKRILQLVFTGIIVYSIVNICVYFLVLHNAVAKLNLWSEGDWSLD